MHEPVLLKESLEILDIHEGDTYLDATQGHSGHLHAVRKEWGDRVVTKGIDADPATEPDAVLNFREIARAPALLGIGNPTKILFDLGWNKSQFEAGNRGFSFRKDEPLNMAFGPSAKFTAGEIVNNWDQENLETILDAYGEEKFARKISEEIAAKRVEHPIETSFDLVRLIESAVPEWYKHKKIHFATRTFQALRIAVNDELEALKEGLRGAFGILEKNGRIAVISFHSLEDRIVKRYFKELSETGLARSLTKKPITAGKAEISANPRSRSAKLRAIEKI
jgi:16S rRNA (cytosine1402-N4)-methyltransferase